jgi:HK97 family phage prohead protease
MSEIIKKVFDLKALDVDTKTRQVKVAISQLESVDRDEDAFDSNAYDKTIKEQGPRGANEIWHLLDHTSKTFSALSKFKEVAKEGKYITGVSLYKDSFAWREVAWPLYEAGDITQHSVGFEILKAEPRNEKGIRIIKEVKLYEGSAVLWGANRNTPTMQVVKSLMNIDEDRDITAAEKIDEIIKKLKQERKGFNEEDYSLFIIELKRLQTLFDAGRIAEIFKKPEDDSTSDGEKTPQLKTTEPEIEATLPDVVECPNCKRHTYNTQGEKNYIKCHRCDNIWVYGMDWAVKI